MREITELARIPAAGDLAPIRASSERSSRKREIARDQRDAAVKEPV
jgi:hypothetical protein